MKEKRVSYLLFIYSTLGEDSPVLRDIPLQLSPISSAPYIKYNYGDSGLICNFETDLPFPELREFVSVTLEGLVDQYFLIEHSDNMSVHMDNSLKLNLFDLNSENKKYGNGDNVSDKQGEDELYKIMDYFLSESMKEIDNNDLYSLTFDEDEDEDPLIRKLKLKKDPKFMKPSLDSLLEKIKEKGIKSLTKYEKQLLNEYAGN
jgi:hypothetical protein